MYATVPTVVPVCVTPSVPASLASPKSRIFTTPLLATSRLAESRIIRPSLSVQRDTDKSTEAAGHQQEEEAGRQPGEAESHLWADGPPAPEQPVDRLTGHPSSRGQTGGRRIYLRARPAAGGSDPRDVR